MIIKLIAGLLVSLGSLSYCWIAQTPLYMPGQTYYPSVTDINKDSLFDIVSTSNEGGVYLWAGDGGNLPVWTPLDTIVLAEYMYKTAIGDFNQDGNPDIAATSWPGVYAWTGDGAYNPTWTPATRPITSGFFIGIDVADLNHDDISDIVAATTGSDHLGINVWLSDGSASPVWTRQPGPGPDTTLRYRYLTIADLNHDGDMDLVAGHQNDNQGIKIWTGNGGSGGQVIFSNRTSPALTGNYFQIAVDDVNNDSHPDIVGAQANVGIGVWIGDGAVNPGWTQVQAPAVNGDIVGVALGDLNNDGNLDIVAANNSNNNVEAWFGNGGPGGNFVWTPAPAFSPSADYAGIVLEDVNQDGKDDVIASFSIGNRIQVWINDLAGIAEARPTIANETGMVSPNPFTTRAVVKINLVKSGEVGMRIFDRLGRLVTTVAPIKMTRGTHGLTWDGTDCRGEKVESGVYFFLIDVDGTVTEKSAVFTR